jgi:hypothetical protein
MNEEGNDDPRLQAFLPQLGRKRLGQALVATRWPRTPDGGTVSQIE